jgi:hypothetical protein
MTSLLERLKFINDLEVGDPQSVDEMTVIPLIGDMRGSIAEPENLEFTRTPEYGHMEFKNTSPDAPAIVPSNMMIRGKGAQDHAMSGSGVVLAASDRMFSNACCVESSQGGLLSSGQTLETDVLPADLRKALLDPNRRNTQEYGKLWGEIKTWLRKFKRFSTVSRAHIRDFFDDKNYKEALEEFAAEFEPVDKQIGALILFNGIPVGLEIMPSAQHWEAYWKWLIRGCYGAQLINLKESGKVPTSTLILPEIPDGANDEEVSKILTDFIQNIRMSVVPMLENIQFSNEDQMDSIGNLKTELLRTANGGGGDVITQNDEPVYLSLVL